MINIDWLSHKGIPSYLYYVTKAGRIYSTESEQILTPHVRDDGYIEYDLKFDGHRHKAKAHHLVCRAFHGPPPPGCTEVDHIDMNRQNNRPENLEWVTHGENIRRRNASGSSDTGGKEKRPVVLLEIESQKASLYLSHKDAIEALGVSPPTFYNRLSTKQEINGKMIYPIINPEVISERVANKVLRSQAVRAGRSTGDERRRSEEGFQGQGGEDEEGSQLPEEEKISAYGQALAEKWGKRTIRLKREKIS